MRRADMFRSKYAKDEVPTFVTFMFDYRGKRYQVKRNPEYQRPKGEDRLHNAEGGGGAGLSR